MLGPLEVRRGSELVHAGGPKARTALAMLAVDVGRVVSTDRLIEGIWGTEPPDGALATLRVHVSNLRRSLGDDVVVTRPPGYLLDADPAVVDLARFEADLQAARAAVEAGDLVGGRDRLAGALALWRGAPLADLGDAPYLETALPWLEERRALAVEEHTEVSLRLGLHREVIGQLEAHVSRTPHRERLWAQLMLALYRAGRPADALAAFQRARRTLADDLGIDPGPELRRLEAAVLAHDPALDLEGDAGAADRTAAADPGETVRAAAQVRCRIVVDHAVEHPLTGATVLGRHPDCDICLPGSSVSRRHVELRPALGGYLLLDLGSSNGTLVNGAPTLHHLLSDGDVLTVGDHTVEYRADPL